MAPYFYLLLIVVLLSVAGSVKTKNSAILEIVISLVLLFFAGLRYKVGTDFESYERMFDLVKNKDFEILFLKEKGFVLFLIFIDKIGGTAQLMFLACAVVIQYFIHKYIKYFKVNFYWAILIFLCISPFYFASFNGLRQSMAIAIFAFSLKYIIERKIYKYFILMITASLIAHTSALFLLPFYFILNKQLEFKWKFIIIIVSIIFGISISKLIGYTPYVNYILLDRVYDVKPTLAVYLFLTISFFIMVFEKKIYIPSKYRNLIINMNLFSFIMIVLALIQGFGTFYMLFMRINNYFFIVYLILLPLLILITKDFQKRKIIYIILSILLMAYYLRTIFIYGVHYHLLPYKFNLELFN